MVFLKKHFFFLFISFIGIIAIFLVGAVVKRNQHNWLPGYLWSLVDGSNNTYSKEEIRHVMFIFADHHEHPFDEKEALKSSLDWNKRYKETIAGFTDDYGNPFQYTWFYRNDHRSEDVFLELSKLVYEGLGEIEFHWHHNHKTNMAFERELRESLSWFQSFGALISTGDNPRTAFGFIHGNWSLDNSLGASKCGVNLELQILQDAGCYADFTFSTGSKATPKLFSSIFYALDDPGPKSYDYGVHSRVGKISEGLMIFEGPSALDFGHRIFEQGAVEAWMGSDWNNRVKLWIYNAPFVKGKPEWRFVKVYTHGVQSSAVILSEKFSDMIQSLSRLSDEDDFRLHFVTSREGYNIVKAAEHGESGDPEKYRDYEIPKPINRVLKIDRRFRNLRFGANCIEIGIEKAVIASYEFRHDLIVSVDGNIEGITVARRNDDIVEVFLSGTGEASVVAKVPLTFPDLPNQLFIKDELYHYVVSLEPTVTTCKMLLAS